MSKKEQVVNELHKPARKNFKWRRVIIKGLDDLWQADLVEMGSYVKENNEYKYLLTVIDSFSKYAWATPIKNKSSEAVCNAMIKIFQHGRIPKNLQTDDGKEIFNKKFHSLMEEYGINYYSTFSTIKAAIVERFNRTIKEQMWKQFSLNGSYKWINLMSPLITNYNQKTHHTIKMKPCDVNASNENMLLSTIYNNIKITDR
ncbi:uncharacterized protein LOC123301413 [Chrysoperla carnea]|uniref:uncharacterized protein LOC123301413 n=1 Tax=Chrysoperla carnea TaxID=189513 RepID=UPI001D07AB62|nr:uncharacterized protein LOC123301413 [Chrysoperla carnea]